MSDFFKHVFCPPPQLPFAVLTAGGGDRHLKAVNIQQRSIRAGANYLQDRPDFGLEFFGPAFAVMLKPDPNTVIWFARNTTWRAPELHQRIRNNRQCLFTPRFFDDPFNACFA
ncbi:MAG: hypothetical protein ACJ8CB_21805, partial [Ktedonobacteraceae bacterium]